METKKCRGDEEKIDTATTFDSSKFGSFILLASYQKSSITECSSEHALIMISSSESGSESVSESGECWWITGGGGGGSTNDQDDDDHNDIITCSSAAAAAVKYQMVFKVDNNNLEDQQQQLMFKLDSLGFPPRYKFCYVPNKLFASPRALDPVEIVGSCNGLVCLYDRDHNKVSLWNPDTGKCRILPKSITIPGKEED